MHPTRKRKSTDDRYRDLASMGRLSFASKNGIASILKDVKEAGELPESFDRRTQYRARKQVCSTATPYGQLVDTTEVTFANGSSGTMSFQHPLAWFAYQCERSPHYADIVRRALAKKPCTPASPWSLIVYQDEVNPSDGLSKNHSRKSVVWYWSFAEFGMHALAHEEMWGTVCLMRSTTAGKLESKVSQLACKVLQLFFGPHHDIRLSGIAVNITCTDGGADMSAHIFADIGVVLADEPALKETLGSKGHAGHKCCCLCINACLHNVAHPYHERSLFAVPITCTSWDRFQKHTDETVRECVQRLNEHHDVFSDGHMTKETFEELERVHGWNWNAFSVILDEKVRLRVASSVMYDWAHTYVNDGLADMEMGQCMKVLHSSRSETTYAEIGLYAASFTYPKARGSPTHVFNEVASKNNLRKTNFTCTASEFLTLAPILHRYFTRVVQERGQCMPYVLSFIAVIEVLLLLQAIQAGCVDSSVLGVAILKHLQLYQAAYGEEKVRPKHHYALHLPDMLSRFGFLLSTFTHERKHRLIKRYTRDRCKLQNWDLGALEEITCHQAWELSLPFFMTPSTITPRGKILSALREVFPGVPGEAFTVHSILKCNGGSARSGDVVICSYDETPQVGELLLIVRIAPVGGQPSRLYSLVALWAFTETACADWLSFFVSDDSVVKMDADCIATSLTYRMAEDRRSALVYIPYEYQAHIVPAGEARID